MGLYKLINKRKIQQQQQRNKLTKAATTTAILGATVGVISGILFAPKSGKETRSDIKQTTVKAKDNIKEKKEQLNQYINNKKAAMKTSDNKDNLIVVESNELEPKNTASNSTETNTTVENTSTENVAEEKTAQQ